MPALRIGLGHDLHRLESGRPFVLGGVKIPHERGPLGHSDGDALLHAVADALLGARGLGDIGTFFPPGEALTAGMDSRKLLEEVKCRALGKDWRVLNVDTVIVTDEPQIGPHREAIAQSLAQLLEIDPSCVGVKAKSSEGVTPESGGAALSASAVVLLEMREES
ncbi:MAG: 2-C-methyl-D-erythritol 2,4-cyclodiphosphate synthase [Candidatus Omnitrophica bacterium]|nr:2-C-methyl-D-erythritol 2,4-cyclodiphosphate synthase [Candidatus Omnitrophota bacterium]